MIDIFDVTALPFDYHTAFLITCSVQETAFNELLGIYLLWPRVIKQSNFYCN